MWEISLQNPARIDSSERKYTDRVHNVTDNFFSYSGSDVSAGYCDEATVDIKLHPGPVLSPDESLWSHTLLALSAPYGTLRENMTSAIKLKVQNILQRCQRQSQATARKIWWSLCLLFLRYTREQTPGHTDIPITIIFCFRCQVRNYPLSTSIYSRSHLYWIKPKTKYSNIYFTT